MPQTNDRNGTGPEQGNGWKAETHLLRRISPQMKYAFWSTMICGILAHGIALFNKYSWHDDLFFMFSPGSTVAAGRWSLHLLSWIEDLFFLDGHFSMPLYNGIIAIFCIAVTACMLVEMLKIRSRVLCACLGCVMAAFPCITGLFAYEFTIHYYMFALILMVGSAYLMCRGRHWWTWLLAVLLGSGALGIYQAFLSILLFLLLMDAMIGLTEREEELSVLFRRILLQFFSLAAIMIIYFAINQLFLQKLHLSLIYPANEMGAVTLTDYLSRIGRAYQEFFIPVRGESWDMYPYRVRTMYYFMLAGDFLLGMRLFFLTARKKKGSAALLLLLLAIVPLGCNFVFVMADHVHGLMTYGQIMQMVFFIFLVDRTDFHGIRLQRAVSGAAALVLGVTGMLYVRIANECYLKFEIEQQEAISFFTTLVTQIKSSEDYRAERPVLFLHEMQIVDPTVTDVKELDAVRNVSFQFNTLEYINNYTWAQFMEIWCGFTPVYYQEEDLDNLPEVQSMPRYPDVGSIQLVHDVLVVNF